ncbi:MAG: oxygen-independent coproporphyrinogen oxidase [Gemmatimonadetes bacterium]|nr:oxygen-independent coproporphyrinogen oxidase [Gemmatimonadota bacterium]
MCNSRSAVPRHVYVHVPFCARRCSYCDFAIAVRREVPVSEYLQSLAKELQVRFGETPAKDVDTIYFGGGTPSRLGGDGLARAVALVTRYFTPAAGAEITIEANPEDVTATAAAQWRIAGVNRVSLGAQSFDNAVLDWMHRTHDGAATKSAVSTLQNADITNLSLDLIFALPESLHRNLENDIDQLLTLEPDHVSLYGLTIEPTTALGKWVQVGKAVEQPEEGYEMDFLTANRLLTSAGFEHYEVSNYAKPGKQAVHNAAYWANVPYVALGPAAHGFDGETRRWNLRNYAEWRDVVMTGTDPIEGSELLTNENRVAESVYLGLRSEAGLLTTNSDHAVIDRWIQAGWASVGADNRLRCTTNGWLRLDSLAAALTHHRSR